MWDVDSTVKICKECMAWNHICTDTERSQKAIFRFRRNVQTVFFSKCRTIWSLTWQNLVEDLFFIGWTIAYTIPYHHKTTLGSPLKYFKGNRFKRCSSDVGVLHYSRYFPTFPFFSIRRIRKQTNDEQILVSYFRLKMADALKINVVLLILQIDNTHSKVGDNFQVSNFESFIKAYLTFARMRSGTAFVRRRMGEKN